MSRVLLEHGGEGSAMGYPLFCHASHPQYRQEGMT